MNRTWKQRLSYMANLAPVRVVLNSYEIDRRAMLHNRKIRCMVFAENHPERQGRASFG